MSIHQIQRRLKTKFSIFNFITVSKSYYLRKTVFFCVCICVQLFLELRLQKANIRVEKRVIKKKDNEAIEVVIVVGGIAVAVISFFISIKIKLYRKI